MNHQHTAIRPAVPDSTYGRRRTNSIVPAVPQMSNIPTHHCSQPLTSPTPTISIQPTPQPYSVQLQQQPRPEPIVEQTYFKPPLPWYSSPGPFPRRQRRRKKQLPPPPPPPPPISPPQQPRAPIPQKVEEPSASEVPTLATTNSPSEVLTPPTTNPPSEVDSTHPTTPSSTAPPSTATSVATKPVPAVPLTPPAVPVIIPKSKAIRNQKDGERRPSISTNGTAPTTPTGVPATPTTQNNIAPVSETKPAPQPATPLSWAGLLKRDENAAAIASAASTIAVNGPTNGIYGPFEEALRTFQIREDAASAPFLEPRGLVNTGNMCFMNAILQMLVFCGPFYYFLDRVSTSTKSFKDNTPLIDTMIMLMREFKVLASDPKSNIKSDDLEAFGEPFVPDFVYEAIRQLKRFSHMRRGHQQDAEEFLGFLLDGLHEEAVEVMKKPTSSATPITNGGSPNNEESGWLEVGPKQKTATTRTTEISESPITKIFGGNLRSVFSVPGLTKSVTLEPYTPLQLDIQALDVKSVVDALKHLTIPEKIHGDFKSPKGPSVTATKQVFIETLPPVLILHLKRFQYDNTGGTQKIWKKIAYPLELEIPREAMSSVVKRSSQPPKYRLIGVVYHHGNSAQGGHYTVDVLRQDAKNWIRLDDTAIQRVAAKDVAVDVKDIGKYNDVDSEEQEGWVNNWEQVSGSGSSGNGQNKGEGKRYVGKDSRVAYILFYQKV